MCSQAFASCHAPSQDRPSQKATRRIEKPMTIGESESGRSGDFLNKRNQKLCGGEDASDPGAAAGTTGGAPAAGEGPLHAHATAAIRTTSPPITNRPKTESQ